MWGAMATPFRRVLIGKIIITGLLPGKRA